MTNEQAEALGRQWIAAGGGWSEGMLCGKTLNSPAFRVVNVPGLRGDCWGNDAHASGIVPDVSGAHSRDWFVSHDDDENGWPDLRDAATRGAALEVVRERWGILVYLHPIADPHHGWAMYSAGLNRPVRPMVRGDTEAEALVVALEQKR